MILLIDMDGVVADLLAKWLKTYNDRYGDVITKEHVVNWDAAQAASKCSSKDFYNIINEPGFFADLNVIEDAVMVTKRLQEAGHILYFVTATPLDSIDAAFYKSKWIDEHFPHIGRKKVIQTELKYLIRGDILLDDSPSNLKAFPGIKIAFDMPYNKNAIVNHRVIDWLDFEQCIHKIDAIKKTLIHK